jgi:ElaB/YqjD/DUF883 family membrane-anchored ribosome-binding protein
MANPFAPAAANPFAAPQAATSNPFAAPQAPAAANPFAAPSTNPFATAVPTSTAASANPFASAAPSSTAQPAPGQPAAPPPANMIVSAGGGFVQLASFGHFLWAFDDPRSFGATGAYNPFGGYADMASQQQQASMMHHMPPIDVEAEYAHVRVAYSNLTKSSSDVIRASNPIAVASTTNRRLNPRFVRKVDIQAKSNLKYLPPHFVPVTPSTMTSTAKPHSAMLLMAPEEVQLRTKTFKDASDVGTGESRPLKTHVVPTLIIGFNGVREYTSLLEGAATTIATEAERLRDELQSVLKEIADLRTETDNLLDHQAALSRRTLDLAQRHAEVTVSGHHRSLSEHERRLAQRVAAIVEKTTCGVGLRHRAEALHTRIALASSRNDAGHADKGTALFSDAEALECVVDALTAQQKSIDSLKEFLRAAESDVEFMQHESVTA